MSYKTYINEITLINFKIHKNLNLKFTKDLIIIIGENAIGKTSILESIFFVGAMKSFFDVDDIHLIQFNEKFSKIKILENHQNTYEVVLSENGKFIKKNQVEYRKLSDYINELNVLSLSNNDEKIINGTPKNKRYFLDFEIARINKKYLSVLMKYKKTLKIRNLCLKEQNIDYTYLEIVSKELILLNKLIIKERIEYVTLLNYYLKENKIFENEIYEVIYKPNVNEEIEKIFKSKVDYDIYTKTTNYGIHKDDLEIRINEKNADIFASYGQIRSIIINLKMAILKIIVNKKNILPVLLFDDIFSGLDINRRNILLKKVENMQVFITTNDLSDIDQEIINNADVIQF